MADITDINSAQSVKIIGSDAAGVETTPVASTPNGDLKHADLLNGGGTQGNLVVGTTAVEVKVGANKLTNRKAVTLQPLDRDMWWGYSSGVTTSTGTPIFKNQTFSWTASDTCTIYVITDQTNQNARITESP